MFGQGTPPTPEELTELGRRLAPGQRGLAIDEARTLYLFGPAVVPFIGDGMPHVAHIRTSLEAALTDARMYVGRDKSGRTDSYDSSRYWLATAGYLMIIDQLGVVLEGGFEALLTSPLAGLNAEEAGALYGLRNAFLHNYGLANDATEGKIERRKLRRHVFFLHLNGDRLVELRDRTDVLSKPLHELPHTSVHLGLVGDLVERVVAEVRTRHVAREALNWIIHDVDQFSTQFFFSHLDPIE